MLPLTSNEKDKKINKIRKPSKPNQDCTVKIPQKNQTATCAEQINNTRADRVRKYEQSVAEAKQHLEPLNTKQHFKFRNLQVRAQ